MPFTFWRPAVRSQIVSSGPTPAPATSMEPDSSASLTALPPESWTHSTAMGTPAFWPCFSMSFWSCATFSNR
ncbi:hypothetical protein GCM10025794_09540 [Massilia kyonggiensis]